MNPDKQIFMQMLDRAVDNLIVGMAPQLAPFSGMAKGKVRQYVDPYLDALIGDDGKIDADTACEFAKDKASAEIEAFKKKLQEGEQ